MGYEICIPFFCGSCRELSGSLVGSTFEANLKSRALLPKHYRLVLLPNVFRCWLLVGVIVGVYRLVRVGVYSRTVVPRSMFGDTKQSDEAERLEEALHIH